MSSSPWFKRIWIRLVWMLTPNCADMTRLASAGLDQEHSWWMRCRIRLHFAICVWCRRYFQQLRFLRDQAKSAPLHTPEPKEPKLSEDAKTRLKRLLEESQRGGK